MKNLILLILLLGSFSGAYSSVEGEAAQIIKDFSTDGCSSFPDGHIPTQTTEWLDCCIIHDIDYWMGGEYDLRKKADENLGLCVSSRANPVLGQAMRYGVFIGGAPSPAPWRWAYGWDFSIKHDNLNEKQLRSAASKFDTVIDAILKEKSRLTKGQRMNIVNKLKVKLIDLLPYLENEKSGAEAFANYIRLYKRMEKLLD